MSKKMIEIMNRATGVMEEMKRAVDGTCEAHYDESQEGPAAIRLGK